MKFEKLVPSIFYVDINDGLKFFVDCLGFTLMNTNFAFTRSLPEVVCLYLKI